MDKTRTVGQKWLANELDLHFLTLKKYTKGQSNQSILSKVIVLTSYKSTDRHTDRHTERQTHWRKPFFRVEGLKTWTFDKNGGVGGVHILHKSNTFSDENVRINILAKKFIFKTNSFN